MVVVPAMTRFPPLTTEAPPVKELVPLRVNGPPPVTTSPPAPVTLPLMLSALLASTWIPDVAARVTALGKVMLLEFSTLIAPGSPAYPPRPLSTKFTCDGGTGVVPPARL